MNPNPWGAPPRAPWYRRAWSTYRSWSRRAQWGAAVVAVLVVLTALGAAFPPPEEIAADGPPATAAPAPTTTAAPTTTTERAVTTTTAAPTTTTTAAPTTTTAPPTTTTLPPTTTTAPPPPTTAATLPPTTAAPPPPPSDCHPSYEPCVPVASDVDCAGGGGDGPAYVDGPVYVKAGYGDPYGLDGNDNDGIGCES